MASRSPIDLAELVAQAGGNPLLIVELVAAVSACHGSPRPPACASAAEDAGRSLASYARAGDAVPC